MVSTRASLLIVNVIGGLAVLASYAWPLATHPGQGDALWGGVPASWRPLYGVSMLLAAAGYLTFASYLLFRVDPATARLSGGLGLGWLALPFLLVLVPSTLWMPLTFRFLESGGEGVWLAIRVVLALVALGSALLLGLLAGLQPREHPVHWALSVAGAAVFLAHTGVLDALLWTSRFRS
jgi:hypothetical protein